jgi:predicted nucleic acid-binding protein
VKLLIDTNVASEVMRPRPNLDVLAWLDAAPPDTYFSVATLSEIGYGILRLEVGARRNRLSTWRDELVRVAGRNVLPVDGAVADAWSAVRARAAANGRPMPLIDALIAATAQHHGLTVVTRNVSDFEAWGGPVFNPWTGM